MFLLNVLHLFFLKVNRSTSYYVIEALRGGREPLAELYAMTNDELDVLLITHCSVMLLFCFVLFLMAVFDSVFFFFSTWPRSRCQDNSHRFLSNISRSVFRLLRFDAHSRLEF